MILIARRGASCASVPTPWIRRTNGAALPSMIGTSGPSSSTTALSMRLPARAASKCSTVATWTPSRLESTVESADSMLLLQSARISAPASDRRKTMPLSGPAGCRIIVTGCPQCNPIPRQLTALRKVRCDAIPISPNMRNQSELQSALSYFIHAARRCEINHCYRLLQTSRNASAKPMPPPLAAACPSGRSLPCPAPYRRMPAIDDRAQSRGRPYQTAESQA